MPAEYTYIMGSSTGTLYVGVTSEFDILNPNSPRVPHLRHEAPYPPRSTNPSS